jgi:hypothetical protein
MTQQPPVNHGVLIIEATLSHADTPHSVRLLWTGDQLDAETLYLKTLNAILDSLTFSGAIRDRSPSNERPKTSVNP